MTKYHSIRDRRGRLLRAIRKLFVEINNTSDRAVIVLDRPRSSEVEQQYRRSKWMISRIDRELKNG